MAAQRVHLSGALCDLRPVERGRMVQAMGRYLLDHIPVEVVIPIVVIFPNVKKSIGLQSVGLVDLKIKADSSHAR